MSNSQNDPVAQLQQALTAIQALQEEVALLHAQQDKSGDLAPPMPVVVPVPGPAPQPFAKVNLPREFTGSSRDARPFLTQCELFFPYSA